MVRVCGTQCPSVQCSASMSVSLLTLCQNSRKKKPILFCVHWHLDIRIQYNTYIPYVRLEWTTSIACASSRCVFVAVLSRFYMHFIKWKSGKYLEISTAFSLQISRLQVGKREMLCARPEWLMTWNQKFIWKMQNRTEESQRFQRSQRLRAFCFLQRFY